MTNPEIRYVSDAKSAPKAVGPYSQATICGNLAFLSGQVALDPETMTLINGGIEEQTEQVFNNIEAVLTHCGLTFKNVVRTTVYLKDMNNFTVMNSIYEKRMSGSRPARSTIEVSRLPKDAMIEIDLIAMLG